MENKKSTVVIDLDKVATMTEQLIEEMFRKNNFPIELGDAKEQISKILEDGGSEKIEEDLAKFYSLDVLYYIFGKK